MSPIFNSEEARKYWQETARLMNQYSLDQLHAMLGMGADRPELSTELEGGVRYSTLEDLIRG